MKEVAQFKTSKKTEMKFITEVLTPQNPKDIYYQNYEDIINNYLMFMLVGLGMVLYMIVY